MQTVESMKSPLNSGRAG